MSIITKLQALEILDSRGNPTVQVTVYLDSGASGTAKVPSGASTGKREAVELRDGDKQAVQRKGVRKAVGHVLDEIQKAIVGFDAADQSALDEKLDSSSTELLTRRGWERTRSLAFRLRLPRP